MKVKHFVFLKAAVKEWKDMLQLENICMSKQLRLSKNRKQNYNKICIWFQMSKYQRIYHTVLDLQMHVKTCILLIGNCKWKPCQWKAHVQTQRAECKRKESSSGRGLCAHREGLVQKERANMCKRKKDWQSPERPQRGPRSPVGSESREGWG